MKFVVAIDWNSGYNSGFDFLELEAENVKDAMIEAPAVVNEFASLEEYNRNQDKYSCVGDAPGMKNVFCLRILKKNNTTKSGETPAKDCGVRYLPINYKWYNDDDLKGQVWYI